MPPLTIQPRTVERKADRIQEVFLSATVKDLEKYRTEVADALSGAKASVFLQEDWAEAAIDVVTLSLNRLADSDAYLGVFGFRYGWIPPGQGKSVTELECDKALDLWGRTTLPPIFWFMPAPGSKFAADLEAETIDKLRDEFPGDETRQELSRRLQKAFCDRLRGLGRFVTPFSSLQMLRESAITSVANWNLEILKAALESTRSVVMQIPLADLGEIDRQDQRDAIDEALQARRDAGSPGLCLAVHGAEDAGQSAFLAALAQRFQWDLEATVHKITPAHRGFDLISLAAATLAEMAPGQTSPTATIDQIAAAIGDRCRAAPVVMLLRHLDRLSDGIDAFRTKFWAPLLAAARALPATDPPRQPFILVLELATPIEMPLPQGMVAEPPVSGAAFDSIVVLPELTSLTASDVETWLRGLKVKLDVRQKIAARVTTDGVPRAVYDRLNAEDFWSTLPT